jgi:hypothetical protein
MRRAFYATMRAALGRNPNAAPTPDLDHRFYGATDQAFAGAAGCLRRCRPLERHTFLQHGFRSDCRRDSAIRRTGGRFPLWRVPVDVHAVGRGEHSPDPIQVSGLLDYSRDLLRRDVRWRLVFQRGRMAKPESDSHFQRSPNALDCFEILIQIIPPADSPEAPFSPAVGGPG